MEYILGAFLILHGLVHSFYFTPKPDDPKYPFNLEKGWFAKVMGEGAVAIGALLAIAVVVFFFLAGLAVMGIPWLQPVGQYFTVFGAATSLVLFVLFWHRWLILGALINLVLLYGIWQLNWTLWL